MVLYLDLIIFKEFIMDFILLITEKTVLKKKTNSIRIILASLIGEIDTILEIFINFNFFIMIAIKIIVSILMIKVIFKTKDVKEFAKELLVFYLISFAYGGISSCIIFNDSIRTYLNTGFLVGKSSNLSILLSIIFGFILIITTLKIIANKVNANNMICDLEICIDGKSTIVKVLLDTGNLLKEPTTKMPVVVIERKKISNLIDINEEINKINKRKIYFIPYKTLGSESKVLFGIRPEYIRVRNNSGTKINDVIVGLYDGCLSENDSYSGLAGVEIFEKE